MTEPKPEYVTANQPQAFEPKSAIYTPDQTATFGLMAIEDAKNKKIRGIPVNVPELRDYFTPVLPGEICVVLGQTSHYKSRFLHFIEREAAKFLVQQERADEILVHISTEESIEEQSYAFLATESGEDAGKLAQGDVQDWSRLSAASIKIGTIPIYRIGDSLARSEDLPNLYLSNMIRSIKYLRDELLDFKPKIAGLFFDYLQAFPIDPEIKMAVHDQQRRLQVRSDIYRLRQASHMFNCPVFVAVQAKQVLSGATPPYQIPGQYDCEETSAVAQRADKILSLWMPKQTHRLGEYIEGKSGVGFTVTEDLLFIKVCKSRGGNPSGKVFANKIDFNKNEIHPITWKEVNINDYSK
jgi:replicative DNA helicase